MRGTWMPSTGSSDFGRRVSDLEMPSIEYQVLLFYAVSATIAI